MEFRFESTVMDGAPVFNNIRNNSPGIEVVGFTGVLNSTSKVVIAMQRGLTAATGIREAQAMGIAEPNASYELDGWDSALFTHGPDEHYRHRLAESRRGADPLGSPMWSISLNRSSRI